MRRYLPWALGAVGAVLYFSFFEYKGFVDPEHYATLSYTIANLAAHWPLAIFIMGGFSFGLAVHFFWPWTANPLGKGGG